MSSEDVTFNCYFNGKFRNSPGNIVTYVGGEVHTLECNPQAFFTNLVSSLNISLYGQRIWYKMPYENNSELKHMCNSENDLNFQRMCLASLWTKLVDIFMEKDDAHENDGIGVDATGLREDGHDNNADVTGSRGGGRDYYGDDNIRDEVVEEEARIEANIAGFVDESEHCNSEVTPPNSDDEEVQSKRRYDRFKKGSGELRTVPGTGTLEIFDRFYVCFHNIRTIWRRFCRPIIGIDGCFLKNNVKGQFLVAVGRDANNQFYPVAWGVVQVESTETWLWFLEKLKADLDLKDGDGFTLISDRKKGLIIAVDQLLPKVEHRMCARHVYGNLARAFPGRSEMKKLFWVVAKSYNRADYDAAIEAMKNYDIRVYESMMTKNPEHCSRAFFTNKACCEDVSNNFAESYNGTIEKARAMPLLEMLETIKRQAMVRIDVRKNKAMEHTGKYSETVAKFIAEEERFRKFCKAFPGPNGTYEVKENSELFKVHMGNRTCACRKFDLVGIPCRHALRVIWQRKENAEDYVSEWYLTTKWQAQYSDSIRPMNEMKFWRKSGMPRLENPPRDTSLGPKKKEKRKKSKFESPKKKSKGKGLAEPQKKQVKATKEGRILLCGRCGLPGHNILKCTLVADGVPIKKKVKKSCPSEQEESMSLGGPTQPSQNSQL